MPWGLCFVSIFSADAGGAAAVTAAQEAANLREELKSYVTQDTSVTLNAPGNPPWHLPEDTSCYGCWALAPGIHDATLLMSKHFREANKAVLKYTVLPEMISGQTVQKVSISVEWDAP